MNSVSTALRNNSCTFGSGRFFEVLLFIRRMVASSVINKDT